MKDNKIYCTNQMISNSKPSKVGKNSRFNEIVTMKTNKIHLK